MSWSLSTPADADPVRTGDDKIREIKADLENALQEEHTFPVDGAAPACYHALPSGTTAARPVAGVAGRWYYNTTTGTIQRDNGATWDDLTDQVVIPSGTATFFCQASPPTGWTRSADFNDKLLRVVSGTGAGTGGAWSISIAAEDFAHDHGGNTAAALLLSGHSGTIVGNQGVPTYPTVTGISSDLAHNSNGSHQHTISSDTFNHGHTIASSWRPKYKDLIMATKD